jgi:hypothetical protein
MKNITSHKSYTKRTCREMVNLKAEMIQAGLKNYFNHSGEIIFWGCPGDQGAKGAVQRKALKPLPHSNLIAA